MPRTLLSLLPRPSLAARAIHPTSPRLLLLSSPFTSTSYSATTSSGNPTSDAHAVNRHDGLDVQSEAVQAGLEKRREAEAEEANTQQQKGGRDSSQGQGVSRVDEGKSNQKAKREHPEAPEPIIGMNEERGKKGY